MAEKKKTGAARHSPRVVMKKIKGPDYPEERGCEGPVRTGSGLAQEHEPRKPRAKGKAGRKGTYMEERVSRYSG